MKTTLKGIADKLSTPELITAIGERKIIDGVFFARHFRCDDEAISLEAPLEIGLDDGDYETLRNFEKFGDKAGYIQVFSDDILRIVNMCLVYQIIKTRIRQKYEMLKDFDLTEWLERVKMSMSLKRSDKGKKTIVLIDLLKTVEKIVWMEDQEAAEAEKRRKAMRVSKEERERIKQNTIEIREAAKLL